MYLTSLQYNEEEAKELELENKTIYFKSNLQFLKCHGGIRKEKMHLLMAPTHGGKSTAVRTMLVDILKNNPKKKILLWLTEETIKEFKSEFQKTFPAHEILNNVAILSEQNGECGSDEIKRNIEEAIELTNCDLVFVDNLTTSTTYPDNNTAQESTAIWLKKLSKKVSLFLIAHTNTDDFASRFLNEQDIRGSKKITNLTEFLYILQPITVGDRMFQFINIKKHRGRDVKNKFFRLVYDNILSIFKEDIPVAFNDIREVFKQRNQLK